MYHSFPKQAVEPSEKRVLLVDDDPLIRETLKTFLADEDYQTREAESAAKALEILEDESFNVIVSDILMPDMNGLELLEKLKDVAPEAAVIMITGSPSVDSAAMAMRGRAFDYLSKPITMSAFLRSVGNAVRMKSLNDERRRLEVQNLKYQAHLEKLVEERTEELRAHRDKLRKSQMLHTAVLRSTPHGLCMLNPGWEIVFANHAMSSILSPDQNVTSNLLGTSFKKLFLSREAFQNYADSAIPDMRKRGIDIRDVQMMRLNGDLFWCEISIVRHDPAQTQSGYVATLTDITKRKNAEGALLKKTFDLNERIKEMNCLYQVMEFLISPNLTPLQIIKGVVSRIPSGFRHPELICVRIKLNDGEFASENFDRCPWKLQADIQLHGEKYGDVAVGYSKMPENEKEPLFLEQEERMVRTIAQALAVILRQKREEKARRETERELENQRVLSMRSDRLRSLGQMATGIAHELNQPLVGVRGLAEYLLISMERSWEMTPDDISEKLNLIVQQADRMTHIINHIRVFARDAGKPETQAVDVNKVVSTASDLLATQFRSRGMRLEIHPSGEPCFIQANPFSIEEVILNLLINARDAVEERFQNVGGGVDEKVTIVTQKSDNESEQRVHIEVIDHGTGVKQEVIEKVFDPFFTTKAPDRGTGLGLSISKSIVEQFDGEIGIESIPGRETKVKLSFPAIEEPEDDE